MLETPEEAAQRISRQMRFRSDSKVFYIAWGSSRKFIGFTRADHAYIQYSEDLERLIGAYRRNTHPDEIAEDLTFFLQQRGLIC